MVHGRVYSGKYEYLSLNPRSNSVQKSENNFGCYSAAKINIYILHTNNEVSSLRSAGKIKARVSLGGVGPPCATLVTFIIGQGGLALSLLSLVSWASWQIEE